MSHDIIKLKVQESSSKKTALCSRPDWRHALRCPTYTRSRLILLCVR